MYPFYYFSIGNVMTDVIKFKKPEPKESPEVLSFKNDLKIFLNYLDKVKLRLSTWAMVDAADTTSNNLTSLYIDSHWTAIKEYYQNVYDTTWPSVANINPGVFITVRNYIDWSYVPDNRIFSFTTLCTLFNLTTTLVRLSDEEVIITNLTTEGSSLLGLLQTHLCGYIRTEENKDFVLTGGSCHQTRPSTLTDDPTPQIFKYVFDRPEPPKPLPFIARPTQQTIANYLKDCMFSDQYMFIPLNVEYIEFYHHTFKHKLKIYPSVDLVLPNILPVGNFTHSLRFTLHTRDVSTTYGWCSDEETFIVIDENYRTDKALLDAIEQDLRNLPLDKIQWLNIETEPTFQCTTKFLGRIHTITWKRDSEGNGSVGVDTTIDPGLVHMRCVELTSAIGRALDHNAGRLLQSIKCVTHD